MEILTGDESDGSVVDLLDDSSSNHGEVKEEDRPEAQQEQVARAETEQATSHTPRESNTAEEITSQGRVSMTPRAPASTSLFERLGELEKQWTSRASSKRKKPPPVNVGSINPNSPSSLLHRLSADDSVSPLTAFEESPQNIATGAASSSREDSQSLSTYGSLGSPRKFAQQSTPVVAKARRSRLTKPSASSAKKSSPKDTVYDRLYRGEKRAAPLWRPPSKPTERRLFFSSPPRQPRPPGRNVMTSVPKGKRKRPTIQPVATPSQQSVASSSGRSVFDRLYRNEKRGSALWTDPGAKSGERIMFVKSGGASRTSMIATSDRNTPRKLSFLAPGAVDGAITARMAISIQSAWRYYHAQSRLVQTLVQTWSVSCTVADDGIYTSNRILRLKYEVLARTTAIRQVDRSMLGRRLSFRAGEVSLQYSNEISFEAWATEGVIHQKYSVWLQCDAKLIQTLMPWSFPKLGYVLNQVALELSYREHTEKYISTAATLLQQWFFAAMHQKRKKSPALSTFSEEFALPPTPTSYASLSWFHHRLQKEAIAAKFTRSTTAAIVIQRHLRAFLARRYLATLRDSLLLKQTVSERVAWDSVESMLSKKAVVIQRAWHDSYNSRAWLSQSDRHQLIIASIISIQSVWRGHHARQFLSSRLAASTATTVQSAWEHRFQDQTSTVDAVQSAWGQRSRKRRLDSLATTIQSFARMCLAMKLRQRLRYRDRLQSIILLQALQRRRYQRAKYPRVVRGVVLLQALFRGHQERLDAEKWATLAVIHAATTIQTAWKQRRTQKAAAQAIQYAVRVYFANRRFQVQRKLHFIMVLQAFHRSRAQRSKFEHWKRCCIRIQSYWRGWQVRRRLAAMAKLAISFAAVTIQNAWRQRFQRLAAAQTNIYYSRDCEAAVKIQSWLQMAVSRFTYLQLQLCAVHIQSWWRKCLAQKNYAVLSACNTVLSPSTMHKMASRIQGPRWGSQIKRQLQLRTHSAILVQQWWRAHYLQYLCGESQRHSAIIVQAMWKCFVCKRVFSRQKAAAIAIQSRYRTFLLKRARRDITAHGMAAKTLQRSWRAHLEKRHMQKEAREAMFALKIQAASRAFLERKKLLQSIAAVVVIQTVWRGGWARTSYLAILNASSVLQGFGRRITIRRTAARQAAVAIQTAWRGYCNYQHYLALQQKSAIIIQEFLLMVHRRRSFQNTKESTIRLQSIWRSMRARRDFTACVMAVKNVQHFWRSYQLKSLSHKMQKETNSVAKIQCHVRRLQARMFLQRHIDCIKVLQSFWRAALSRKSYLKIHCSVIAIQAVYRMHFCRESFSSLKRAACIIQSAWRVYVRCQQVSLGLTAAAKEQNRMACKMQRFARSVKRRSSAAVLLQRWWRRIAAQIPYVSPNSHLLQLEGEPNRHCKRDAVVKIQAVYRGFAPKQAFLAVCSASLQIQRFYRGYASRRRMLLASKAARKLRNFLRARYAVRQRHAVKIQCLARGYHARGLLLLRHRAAIRIQGSFVSAWEREKLKKRNAVSVIQASYRGFPVRQAFLALRLAAIRLQSSVRRFLVQRLVLQYRASCFAIQCAWRTYKTRCGEIQEKQRLSASKMQAISRGVLSRRKIHLFSAYATAIQRIYRGKFARAQYVATLEAIGVLQHFAKRVSSLRTVRQTAAIVIQSVLSEFQIRRKYLLFRNAVICIQSLCRMRSNKAKYCKLRALVLVAQSTCRSYLVRRKGSDLSSAATVVQRFWCTYLRRRQVREQEERAMAIIIQSWFRARQSLRLFQSYIAGANIVQSWWRATLMHLSFLAIRNSAILLQSLVRSQGVMRMVSEWNSAASKIQLTYANKKTLLPRYRKWNAALVIQRNLRICICRKNMATLALCAPMIPLRTKRKFKISVGGRVWGSRIRVLLRDRFEMALKIQTWWRKELCRSVYSFKLVSIIRIQHWVRQELLPLVRMQKTAALCIQSWWRMALAQSNYVLLVACTPLLSPRTTQKMTTRIQGLIWGSRLRRHLRYRVDSAVVLQRWWRMQHFRHLYKLQKQSAAIVKSAIKLRCPILKQRRMSATQLQTLWRKHSARDAYLRHYRSILVLQALAKKRILLFHSRKEKTAATFIQNLWRMLTQRAAYLNQRYAAVAIQRCVRLILLPCIRQEISSAIYLQAWWRKYLAQENYARLSLCSSLMSTATKQKMAARIQGSAWGSRLKKQFRYRHDAAVVVQRWWRMHSVLQLYKLQKRAAAVVLSTLQRLLPILKLRRVSTIRIQAFWRRQSAQCTYLQYIHTILALQGFVKRWLLLNHKSKRLAAATSIQKMGRMHLQHILFLHQRQSIIIIQQFFRDILVPRIQKPKLSATCLQAWWRKCLAQANYSRLCTCNTLLSSPTKHKMAQKIQGTVWGSRIRQQLQRRLVSALVLQRWWRATSCRSIFLAQKRSAQLLQTAMRRLVPSAKHKRIAATRLQSYFRMVPARRNFLGFHHGLLMLQARIKKKILLHIARQESSAFIVQAMWKCSLCRRVFLRQRAAAIAIQSRYRIFLLGRKVSAAAVCQSKWRALYYQSKFHSLRHSAVLIQASYRAHICHRHLLVCQQAAKALQGYWRAHLKKRHMQKEARETMSALKIQAASRALLERKKLLQSLAAVVVIQTVWRGQMARTSYLALQSASSALQRFGRSIIIRRTAARQAAVAIQTAWKGYCNYQHYLALQQKSAIIIQKVLQMGHQRRSFQNMKESALKLQSIWRSTRARRDFTACVMAAKNVQHFWRSYQLKSIFKTQNVANSVAKIQCHVRGLQARKFLRRHIDCIKVLQSFWRAAQSQRRYLKMRSSAIFLQSLTRRLQVQSFWQVRGAVVLIQTHARKSETQKAYHYILCCVHLLQSWSRQTVDRRKFLNQRLAILKVQAALRFWLYRRRLEARTQNNSQIVQFEERTGPVMTIEVINEHYNAVCMAQALCRMHLQRMRYCEFLCGVVKLQKFWRSQLNLRSSRFARVQAVSNATVSAAVLQGFFRMVVFRKHYIRLRGCILHLQAQARRFLVLSLRHRRKSAVLIQAHVRRHEVQKALLYIESCVCLLQSWSRQILIRRQFLHHRAAVVLIQKFFRSLLLEQTTAKSRQMEQNALRIQRNWRIFQRRHQQKKAKVATAIQSYQRAYACQYQYCLERVYATLIQAACRGFLMRKSYSSFLKAIVVIQSKFRGRSVRAAVGLRVGAALIIQNFWARFRQHEYSIAKGCVTRIDLVLQGRAVLVVQRAWKRHLGQKRLLKAICLLQSMYRMHHKRLQFLTGLRAVIKFQSLWRSHQVRNKAVAFSEDGRLVEYKLKEAALFVQQWWKLHFHLRSQRLKSAVKIQTEWRRYSCLDMYYLKRVSACSIQAAIRRTLYRQEYVAIIKAIVTVQSSYRGHHLRASHNAQKVPGTSEYNTLSESLQSARAIQQWWKLRLYHLQCQRVISAVKIQKVWRRHSCLDKYYLKRVHISSIQAAIRKALYRQKYVAIMKAAISLQSRYRGCYLRALQNAQKVSHSLTEASGVSQEESSSVRLRSARAIQSFWKATFNRRRTSRAATMVQTWYRMHEQRARFQHLFLRAALRLQSFWRMYTARTRLKKHVKASLILQRSWRDYYRRSTYMGAILKLQRYARMVHAQRKYGVLQAQISLINAAYCGFRQRCIYFCIRRGFVLFQSIWRKHAASGKYLATKQASIAVQRWWRQIALSTVVMAGSKHLSEAKIEGVLHGRYAQTMAQQPQQVTPSNASITVQSWWLNQQNKLHQQHRQLIMTRAAMRIQSHWRRAFVCSRIGGTHMDSACKLLYMLEGLVAEEATSSCKTIILSSRGICSAQGNNVRAALVKLQAWIRRFIVQCFHQRKLSAALKIQAVFIEWRLDSALLSLESSVVLMKRMPSATYFALQHVNHELSSAVIMRRSNLLGDNWTRTINMCCHFAAIVIQRAVARFLAMNRALTHWTSLPKDSRSSSLMQQSHQGVDSSYFLMFAAMSYYNERKSAAREIQLRFRTFRLRARFQLVQRKAIKIQSLTRKFLARQQADVQRCQTMQLETMACVQIQACLRSWSYRNKFARRRRAVSRNKAIEAELQDFFNTKIYARVSRAANREVERLLRRDTTAEQAAGICLRRLSQRVVLGRLDAAQDQSRLQEANNIYAAERSRCGSSQKTGNSSYGVENQEPQK